ncbi:TRAP transporter large permease [Roseovarius spongiae]|uniref:TRAP transporter large permease protein n=1 Tax=Roseovarius spongiae TaxID=2320272 RepID=A0A3A8B1W9_9RHOB|nr:TRAP transporter large permease [Roseovarius spongiae]RKF12670.1 TRAP transporter large permease [Roseovarius spongiae]
MSGEMIGVICMLMALVLILLRLSIGLALIIVSFLGFIWIANLKAAMSMIASVPFAFVGDWNLSAIPMFLLMGYVASATGLTTGLFRAARLLLSRLPGGLAVSSVGASGLFAAASGSSIATSAAMAKIATPEMLRHGYHPGLATGVIAAGGTLGSMIPPSILLLLYGYYAEVSIGQLFIAGVIPGMLTMVFYSVMIILRCKLKPELAPPVHDHPDLREILSALKDVWPLPVLIVSVMVGIFVGIFTPTQAGSIGALVACLIAMVRGTLTFNALRNAVEETLHGTAGIFLILIGTTMLTNFLALSGLPTTISAGIIEAGVGTYTLLIAIAIVYIFLGMFVDSIGLMLLTLPIIMPLVDAYGIDLVWLGIIIVKLLEIGLMTPPVGLNVYVINSAVGSAVSLNTIFRGVSWFIATDLICLSFIVAFPALATYLPRFVM